MLEFLNTDRSRPLRVNVHNFLCPLLFPPGDQCCYVLVYPSSGSSSTYQHFCLVKLYAGRDVCCACKSTCSFILSDKWWPGSALPTAEVLPTRLQRCLHLNSSPGAGIMEADDRQVTTVFTVQLSFYHRHSTNRVS